MGRSLVESRETSNERVEGSFVETGEAADEGIEGSLVHAGEAVTVEHVESSSSPVEACESWAHYGIEGPFIQSSESGPNKRIESSLLLVQSCESRTCLKIETDYWFWFILRQTYKGIKSTFIHSSKSWTGQGIECPFLEWTFQTCGSSITLKLLVVKFYIYNIGIKIDIIK